MKYNLFICLYCIYHVKVIFEWCCHKIHEHSFRLQCNHSLPPLYPHPHTTTTLFSQDATCANNDSVWFKIAQLILPTPAPQVQYVPEVNELSPFPSFGLEGSPPEDGAIFH